MATLLDRWPEVVGEGLASRIKAVAVRGSELLVSVDDPAWASQISWLETQLLERIDGMVGPGRITAVRVRVEPARGTRPIFRTPRQGVSAHRSGRAWISGPEGLCW